MTDLGAPPQSQGAPALTAGAARLAAAAAPPHPARRLCDEIARLITNGVAAGPARVKDTVAAFADIGADELILNPTVGDLEEITRLADIVL